MQEYSVFCWLWTPSAIKFIHRFESPLCITIRHTFIVRLISHSATELSTNPGKIVIKSWLWCKSYNLLPNSLFFSLYDVFVNCNLHSKGLFYFNKPFIIHSHFINFPLKDTNFWILWFKLKYVPVENKSGVFHTPPFSPKNCYYQNGSEWPKMHFKHPPLIVKNFRVI